MLEHIYILMDFWGLFDESVMVGMATTFGVEWQNTFGNGFKIILTLFDIFYFGLICLYFE